MAVHQTKGELVAQRVSQSKKLTIEETKPQSSMIPLRLVVQVSDEDHHPRLVSIPMQEKILIGRSSSNSERKPEIDLASFHALENGVSRWHARFAFDGKFLSIEDLNSTNGTRINGFQLNPSRMYRVRSGDEIEIGRLRLSISLVHVPIL